MKRNKVNNSSEVRDVLRLALNGTAPVNNANSTFPLIAGRLSLRSCLCSACGGGALI